MKLVYDTSIFVDLERNKPNSKILESSKGMNICISSPTVSELWIGVTDKSEEKKEKLDKRIEKYKILNTTKESSQIFAELKWDLISKGEMIPDFDILIASIVIDNKAKLLTKDKHFEKITGLDLEIVS